MFHKPEERWDVKAFHGGLQSETEQQPKKRKKTCGNDFGAPKLCILYSINLIYDSKDSSLYVFSFYIKIVLGITIPKLHAFKVIDLKHFV